MSDVLSLVIPVYRNETGLPSLLDALRDLHRAMDGALEVVFVVDGSPDRCAEILGAELPKQPFDARLLVLSRNFGAFAAVRAGLAACSGDRSAVMAADLQEPPELIHQFNDVLKTGDFDIVVGQRMGREDSLTARIGASVFWSAYRRFVQRDMPVGGIDVFGCTRSVREDLLRLEETNTSLVGQLIWLGYRRESVQYVRRRREHGTSSWTLRKKLGYLSDSLSSFSDLPIRTFLALGMIGLLATAVLATAVIIGRLSGAIAIPGYSATALIVLFFGALNTFGLGVVGNYTWRAYENSKHRPGALVMRNVSFQTETHLHNDEDHHVAA